MPEYIRLIAQSRFTDAYLLNRQSNVFPGVLGRTCDRPCEPACRRTRVDGKPVAICRLKRVAADHRDEVEHLLPRAPDVKNGKNVALIGAGPASLTVANDLAPLGYAVTTFEKLSKPGGLMRVNIPAFRLPWYEIRVSKEGHTARTPHFDLMLALNAATVPQDVAEVRSGGWLLYDSSWPLDASLRRPDVTCLGVPSLRCATPPSRVPGNGS